MHRGVTQLSVILLFSLSCSLKAPPVFLEEIQASGVVIGSGEVALPLEKAEPLLLDQFRKHGGFSLAVDGATPAAQSISGKVMFWAEVGKTAESAPAEMHVLLEIRPLENDDAVFELSGNAVLRPFEDKTTSVLRALSAASEQAIRKAHAVFSAWKKQDVQLLRDLRSSDVLVSNAAIDVLAFRRNPAVANALLNRLSSDDLVEIRRAIGGLVELRESRAVGPLIELGKTQDLSFLRETLFAIGAIGGEEAQGYLFTVAQGHDVPAIREVARQALLDISNPPPRKEQ